MIDYSPATEEDEIARKVVEIVGKRYSFGHMSDDYRDADFEQHIGLDSLEIANLRTDFENEFGISISDEDLEGLKTVRDVTDYIRSKISI
jgi:acyl carrier protein